MEGRYLGIPYTKAFEPQSVQQNACRCSKRPIVLENRTGRRSYKMSLSGTVFLVLNHFLLNIGRIFRMQLKPCVENDPGILLKRGNLVAKGHFLIGKY